MRNPLKKLRNPFRDWRGLLKKTARAARQVFIRFYTLCILAVVVWAGYMAFVWLIKFVFIPTPVPARLLEWQARIDAATLRTDNVPGVTGDADRAPLGHYHKVEKWFQPDKLNGCTVPGCHEPLPHTKQSKIPAFANFHTTFLACEMCHQPPESHQKVLWITTSTYQPQPAPAVLRMIQFLAANDARIKAEPAAIAAPLLDLLRQLIAPANNDPILCDLLLRLETTEPASPVWRRAVDRLIREVPNHARGEYGAKLARENARSFADHAATLRDLGNQYAARHDPALKDKSHANIRNEAAACTACHGDPNPLIDYEQLGYTPERSRTLSRLELANLMQRIRQGDVFQIPNLLGGGHAK